MSEPSPIESVAAGGMEIRPGMIMFADRPFVVIDPDDRRSVERLRDLFDAAWSEQNAVGLEARTRGERGNALQAALREYANPTPPIYRDHPSAIAPWPEVGECHSRHIDGHECPQCAWTHIHDWVAWTHPHAVKAPGVPVRCSKCGGRKCDVEACALQRHHDGDHEPVQ